MEIADLVIATLGLLIALLALIHQICFAQYSLLDNALYGQPIFKKNIS